MGTLKLEDHGFFNEILEIWGFIYPYLEVIGTIGSCIGFTQWVKNFFKKKIPNPHTFTEYIYRQDKWSHVILADELDISKEEAKKILDLFGYKWNNSEKLYYITEEDKKEKIEKINSISVFGKEE